MINIVQKEIQKFLTNEAAVADYRAGIDLIKRSGILELLNRINIPSMISHGSDVQAMAAQAAWANGAQSCIERLKYFEEIFESEVAPKTGAAMTPDFGGDTQAIQRGHLSPKDIAAASKVRPIK